MIPPNTSTYVLPYQHHEAVICIHQGQQQRRLCKEHNKHVHEACEQTKQRYNKHFHPMRVMMRVIMLLLCLITSLVQMRQGNLHGLYISQLCSRLTLGRVRLVPQLALLISRSILRRASEVLVRDNEAGSQTVCNSAVEDRSWQIVNQNPMGSIQWERLFICSGCFLRPCLQSFCRYQCIGDPDTRQREHP